MMMGPRPTSAWTSEPVSKRRSWALDALTRRPSELYDDFAWSAEDRSGWMRRRHPTRGAAVTSADLPRPVPGRSRVRPVLVPRCEPSYCSRHWSTQVVMDHGFYDCTYGT